jgi:pyruvate kinase
MARRTRIVATIGPATDPPDVLRRLLAAGVDVARINFSHGTAEEHLARIARLRETAAGLNRNVAVLADLPGPKLRVRIAAPRELAEGADVAFSTRPESAAADDIVITEPELLRDVRVGHRVLLDDGRLQLEVVRTDAERVTARVTAGGTLCPNKGLNLPDTPLTIAALTQRDRDALAVAARAGVDWLALSFVRQADAADELRRAAREAGLAVPVLAKMERPEAVARAAEIVATFDGIMVARGDLGVEIPLERVPTVQKQLISLARYAGKPVITATDMLDSMREHPRPTRAEASDVANAIYDGTDAVMLSGETAVGQFPVETVGCMSRIAVEAEIHLGLVDHPKCDPSATGTAVDDHITELAVELAVRVKADVIITPTLSGRTARLLARHRPPTAIVAPAPAEAVLRRMAIVWGLQPVLMADAARPGDDRIGGAVAAAFAAGAVPPGALVVVLARHPIEGGEHLPTIRLLRVGPGGRATEP